MSSSDSENEELNDTMNEESDKETILTEETEKITSTLQYNQKVGSIKRKMNADGNNTPKKRPCNTFLSDCFQQELGDSGKKSDSGLAGHTEICDSSMTSDIELDGKKSKEKSKEKKERIKKFFKNRRAYWNLVGVSCNSGVSGETPQITDRFQVADILHTTNSVSNRSLYNTNWEELSKKGTTVLCET